MKILSHIRRFFGPESGSQREARRADAGFRIEPGGVRQPERLQRRVLEGGEWVEDWRKGKLRVRAKFPSDAPKRVSIRLAGEVAREVPAEPGEEGICSVSFAFGKSSLAHFPNPAELELEVDGAVIPHTSGRHTVAVEVPRGDGTLHQRLRDGYVIDKWGQLKLPIALKPEWANAVLSLYVRFADYFDRRFEQRPFFIAGSLLGLVRENGFLPFDDDMDVGYYSMLTSPEAVRDEMFEMLRAMLEDGWDVRLGHNGGFYKVVEDGVDFDVFPSWAYESRIWLPQSQSMPAEPDLMHPPRAVEFLGARVFVPNRAEDYLALHYGPNWREPDPTYLEKKKPGVLKVLKRARLTEEQRSALEALRRR